MKKLLLALIVLPFLFTTKTSLAFQEPIELVFVENEPTGFDYSEAFIIPEGYSQMTWEVSSTDFIINWVPQVSYDGGNTWLEQHRFRCNTNLCDMVTIPIVAPMYRFSHGTSGGNLTAKAVISRVGGDKAILLGADEEYPFSSKVFKVLNDGFITIAAGAIDNPQHLVSISVQRMVSRGIFEEVQHLDCDGGAECPFSKFPIEAGYYRVVVDGSGTGLMLSTLIQK